MSRTPSGLGRGLEALHGKEGVGAEEEALQAVAGDGRHRQVAEEAPLQGRAPVEDLCGEEGRPQGGVEEGGDGRRPPGEEDGPGLGGVAGAEGLGQGAPGVEEGPFLPPASPEAQGEGGEEGLQGTEAGREAALAQVVGEEDPVRPAPAEVGEPAVKPGAEKPHRPAREGQGEGRDQEEEVQEEAEGHREPPA